MVSKRTPSRSVKKRREETEITDEIFKPKEQMVIRELPWTEKQRNVIGTILHSDTQICLINAPAGVGKSTISLYTSLVLLRENLVKKILIIRSPVESCDAKIGFLPSGVDEKLQPYLQPSENIAIELLSKGEIARLKNDGLFSILPVGFTRGLSMHDTAIIIEEASDMSLRDLELLFSRFGRRSKLIVVGSPRQACIKNSGFQTVFNLFNTEESKAKGIFCFEFFNQDSKRSSLSKYILEKFENINPNP